jgi:hypothetical protein
VSAPPGRIATFLSSNAIVGATAILAFVLSLGQLIWPIIRDKISSYSVDLESPDLVNLFCEGSEGIDVEANQRPICNGNNRVVFLATPLFYRNTGWGDKTVWLRREIVDITFLDRSERPVKEIALAWERVSSSDKWHSPGVEQIEPEKAISHSTLFYPESFGCVKDISSSICQAQNSYKWSEFAEQVISHNITHAVFTFKPDMIPSNLKVTAKCRWTFRDIDIDDLKKWRDELGQMKNLNPQRAADSTGTSPPYALLSANCEPLDASP